MNNNTTNITRAHLCYRRISYPPHPFDLLRFSRLDHDDHDAVRYLPNTHISFEIRRHSHCCSHPSEKNCFYRLFLPLFLLLDHCLSLMIMGEEMVQGCVKWAWG